LFTILISNITIHIEKKFTGVSMDFKDILRSPCCYAPLEILAKERINGIVYNGSLTCKACSKEYPIVKGVYYLCLLTAGWDIILQELISRRNITQKIFETAPSEEFQQRSEEQESVAGDIMERLFTEALKVVEPTAESRILDVGAGECKTSLSFAERSRFTVAVDSDPSGLHFVNFSVFRLPPPNQRTVHQRVYFEYAPEASGSFFERVIAPAEHLPFASNSFDVVFCRSTLHHLAHLSQAIREMVRVAKPGGKIVFCSEPIRSIIDPEVPYIEDVVHTEEGLNERCPHILKYLLPLLKEKVRVSVQYWRREPAPPTKKLIRLVPFDWDKHFVDGELASGRKLLKLLLTSASVNIYAKKSLASPDKMPSYWDCREVVDSLEKIIDVYGRRDWEGIWSRWTEDTGELMKIRRAILRAKKFYMSEFIPHKMKPYELWQGWQRRAIVEGKPCRQVHTLAIATLRKPALARRIAIEYFAMQEEKQGILTLKINNKEIGDFRLQPGRWQTLQVALPEVDEEVIDVTIKLAQFATSASRPVRSGGKQSVNSGERTSPTLFIHRIFFEQ
ncbi:methyltransferase domain-containing protein, partial [Candidatus Sumerlaeota bacterium]|nr:methyltransferase domain-containing protein [Candidatus Sumerlaeota bacterium]